MVLIVIISHTLLRCQWAQVAIDRESLEYGPYQHYFCRTDTHDDESGQSRQIIFAVKAAGVRVPQVRDLRGVIGRDNAEIGVFLCFEQPTKPMLKEAAEAGFYKSSDGTSYPRLQILTTQQLLNEQQPQYPLHRRDATFKKAPRSRPEASTNYTLPLLPSD